MPSGRRERGGRKEAAAGRSAYHPVFFAEPLAGNEAAVGYDLGSESVRRAGLQEAARTGSPTATDPVTLVQETGRQPGMLVYSPVFSGHGQERVLRGFALVVLRLESILQSILSVWQSDRVPAMVDLYRIEPNATCEYLVSSPPGTPEQDTVDGLREADVTAWYHDSLHIMYPLFMFGKAYALVIHPGKEFLKAHPARAGWAVGLAGGLLAVILTAFVARVVHHRIYLETQVQLRTAQLQASEENLRVTLHAIGDGVIATDVTGRVTRMNRVAENLTGWPLEEAAGKRIAEVFRIIDVRTRETVPDPIEQVLGTGEVVRLADHTALIARDGAERVVADRAVCVRSPIRPRTPF